MIDNELNKIKGSVNQNIVNQDSVTHNDDNQDNEFTEVEQLDSEDVEEQIDKSKLE